MKASLLDKLKKLSYRFQELGGMLGDPAIINDQERYRTLSKEYTGLEPLIRCYKNYVATQEAIASTESLLKEDDPELKEMAQEEFSTLKEKKLTLEEELQILLLPKDPNDSKNIFLEIRAGTGGDEAAIFSGDLFRMYSRFAENQHWSIEVISEHESEQGGYKEVIARIIGKDVYSQLKFESGAHRVQRVPTTESQGRIHTSACTVAILPEADEIDEIKINPSELRIDTFRASGAGGQHVNKTDSAIRITHLPSGIVVECQDERSQHKNKARALSLLQAKINRIEQEKQAQKRAQERKLLIGSGDRSQRIRTYNFPQGRVTDHRIHLTLYQLDDILAGNLACVIDPLTRELQAEQLAESELN